MEPFEKIILFSLIAIVFLAFVMIGWFSLTDWVKKGGLRKFVKESTYQRFWSGSTSITTGALLGGDLLKPNNEKRIIDNSVLKDICSRNLLSKPLGKLRQYELVGIRLEEIGLMQTSEKLTMQEVHNRAKMHGLGPVPDIVVLYFVNFYDRNRFNNGNWNATIVVQPIIDDHNPYYSRQRVWSIISENGNDMKITHGDPGLHDGEAWKKTWYFVQLREPITSRVRHILRGE